MYGLRAFLACTALVGSLSGCSSFNPISAILPSPSTEVAAQLGKDNTQNKAVLQNNQKLAVEQKDARAANNTTASGFQSAEWQADSIKIQQVNQQPIGILYLLLLIAGWVLPDPVSIFNVFKKTITRRRVKGAKE